MSIYLCRYPEKNDLSSRMSKADRTLLRKSFLSRDLWKKFLEIKVASNILLKELFSLVSIRTHAEQTYLKFCSLQDKQQLKNAYKLFIGFNYMAKHS